MSRRSQRINRAQGCPWGSLPVMRWEVWLCFSPEMRSGAASLLVSGN
ncbi:MAG: hypothetical protein OEM02_05395 [Desulfobulbaceae bacterium]|nr:hypothetical protein [Desulfobulbaceae bacterium]